MSAVSDLNPGTRLYDHSLGQERQLHQVEIYGSVAFLSFLDPQTGAVDRQPFPIDEVETRFETLDASTAAFQGDPVVVRLVAEAYRLQHAYLFNPVFATETSLIDLLPHQLAAVYGVPPTDDNPQGHSGMLDHPHLRFLLADDAGAGKTIMAGLVIREMLLRRLVQRVLVAAPAGLVGNWEAELRRLFGLRFRILSGSDVTDIYNPFDDPRNNLAIVSVDTLARERMYKAYEVGTPYDLVIFDEAHKLSAWRESDMTVGKSLRYRAAEMIARQGRNLLLMTATPHMGKDDPYYFLWQLLEPELFSTPEALQKLSRPQRQRYILRRMKEEMVHFDSTAIYPPRDSNTVEYPLSKRELELYDGVTVYCETHYDRAKLRNRSAAGLAMSILQRRLASSTLAMLRSLQRREQKLTEALRDLKSGLLSQEEWEARQQDLPAEDIRDHKTADEEEVIEGLEESERQDDEVAAATDAVTVEELRAELSEVKELVRLAQDVYDLRRESKFEELWEALEAYPDTKVLIFTEFRDTLEFLLGRLEGKGLTGNLACIHGGMNYKERGKQVDFFRDAEGARIMVATDAAGEGINLQFCWLLINYDIPWNPARLEQRMGRVHRYKQEHPVLLLNVVSSDTREGRVLKVLLDKLQRIREELGSDKVFDIIGHRFSGHPLQDLIFQAVVEGREEETVEKLERTVTKEQMLRFLEQQRRKVEIAEVRAVLDALNQQREIAEMRRMMPAYMRGFFELATPKVGVGIRGDIEETFSLNPCPESVHRALETYPLDIRDRLTFERDLAIPGWSSEPKAIYLYPGEPVFEAVMDLFLGQYEPEATRGAVYLDPDAADPYLFYLGRVSLLRNQKSSDGEPENVPEVLEEQVVGVRRYTGGRMEQAPAHLLMTLLEAESDHLPESSETFGKVAAQRGPVEAFLIEHLGLPALQRHRSEEEARLPEQRRNLRVAYNLRQAELMRQRRLLKERVERGIPAAATKLRACEAELNDLDRQRREAEARLLSAPEWLQLGPVGLYAQALVLPVPPEEAERRRDVQAEKIAIDLVRQREEAEGSVVEDVSDPHLKAGFDLKVLRADGSMRYVEVKGRSGAQVIEMTANEWTQAANHRERYWLYVVYHCDTTPTLYQVPDPFGRLLARQTGAVRIKSSDVMAAAEQTTGT
jgi:superfamily II DNA or RNA helicase